VDGEPAEAAGGPADASGTPPADTGPAGTAPAGTDPAGAGATPPGPARPRPEQNDDADSVTTASSFIEGDISAHPTLNGAFAANVITAEGAASGIQHAGKSGKVKLATFDADPTQVSDLKNRSVQLAIAQEPGVEAPTPCSRA
jgi:hypothetical protein